MDKTIIKQLFKINKTPFPWQKAINAGICAGFPVLIGVLIGKIPLGLLGGIGSFSYLYVIHVHSSFNLNFPLNLSFLI